MSNVTAIKHKRRNRNGELPRHEVRDGIKQVPIQCGGIAAMAMHVNTIDGYRWRCNRCGARVLVAEDIPAYLAERAPLLTPREQELWARFCELMGDHAVR